MTIEIKNLEDDVALAIEKNRDALEIIKTLYGRALETLDYAVNVDQVNRIRHQITAVVGYVNTQLKKTMSDRKDYLANANKGNRTYLNACIRAGAMWKVAEKPSGRPAKDDVESGKLLTAEIAGFTSRRDAQRCVRASELHDEDLRIYFEECDKNGRQYTLGGLEYVWIMTNKPRPEEEPGKVKFKKRSLVERIDALHTTGENILGEIPEEWEAEQTLLSSALGFIAKCYESAKNRDVGEPTVPEDEIDREIEHELELEETIEQLGELEEESAQIEDGPKGPQGGPGPVGSEIEEESVQIEMAIEVES